MIDVAIVPIGGKILQARDLNGQTMWTINVDYVLVEPQMFLLSVGTFTISGMWDPYSELGFGFRLPLVSKNTQRPELHFSDQVTCGLDGNGIYFNQNRAYT